MVAITWPSRTASPSATLTEVTRPGTSELTFAVMDFLEGAKHSEANTKVRKEAE